ncbi:leucine-rich repeat-containing protein 42 [Discoglossus pictus]
MSWSSETSEDTGPVYVRENGKLCVAGSLMPKTKIRPGGLFPRGFSVELCIRQEETCKHRRQPFIFTYTQEGNLRYSAKSLFTLTLDLIVDNIQHVDSLVGFPEQVGEKLFTAAEARQGFYTPSSGPIALGKFTEAYRDLVLSSLCLRGRYLLVSERLEEIKLFQNLHCLDLSCCKLGDEHELLGHLTTISSLTALYLKDNCLSDAGVRRMTAPLRVLHRGPAKLSVLDVSWNPEITDLGVAFLFVFKHLDFLDISGTGVKDPGATAHKVQARTRLRRTQDHLAQFSHHDCRTQGWAEQLVTHWENLVTSAIKPKDTAKTRRVAQSFYGDETRRHARGPEPSVLQSPQAEPTGRLQFYRPDPQRPTPGTDTGQNPLKRIPARWTPEPLAPSAKRRREALTEADWDLLNKY